MPPPEKQVAPAKPALESVSDGTRARRCGLGCSLYAVGGGVAGVDGCELLDGAAGDGGRVATAEEVGGELGGDAVGGRAAEAGKPPAACIERALELGRFLEGGLD